VAKGITQPGLPVGPEAVIPPRSYGVGKELPPEPVSPPKFKDGWEPPPKRMDVNLDPNPTPEELANASGLNPETLELVDWVRVRRDLADLRDGKGPVITDEMRADVDMDRVNREVREGILGVQSRPRPVAVEPPKPTTAEEVIRGPKPPEPPPAAPAAVEPPKPPVAPAAPSAVVTPETPKDSVQTLNKAYQPSTQVYDVNDTSKVGMDPKTYQFKESDAQGSTGRLAGVESWEKNSPPVLLHERADGSLWVADGHQRFNLYKKLKAAGQELPPLKATIVREADGWDTPKVRRLASRLNIMEGSAKPLDIAKLLKTGPLTDAERATIAKSSTTGAALGHGEGLAKLSDEALQAVINGEAHPEAVSAVSKYFTDPVEQLAAVRAIGRRKIRYAAEGEAYAASLRDGMLVRKEKTNQEVFDWGNDAQFQDLAGVRAKLVTKTQRWLIERKAAFRDVLKRKGILEEAKFSMDEETGKALGEEAGSLLGYFKKYADQAGTETNRELRALSQELYGKSISPEAATDRLAAAVRRDIESGGGDSGTAPAALPVAGRPDGAGRDGVVAPEAKPVQPVEPTATVAESEKILQQGAKALNQEAPPLAEKPPLTLVTDKAAEGMPPPTKAELEAAGQKDMFAEPEAPKPPAKPTTAEEVIRGVAPPAAEGPFAKGDFVTIKVPTLDGPKNRAGTVTRLMPDGQVEIRRQDGGYETRSPGEVTRVKVVEPPQKLGLGKPLPEEPTVPEVEAERPAVRDAIKPAEAVKDMIKGKPRYKDAPEEEYVRIVRARNAAMDAASQRGPEFVKRIAEVKPGAEKAYEEGGVQAVEKYWADIKAKIDSTPVKVKDWTPPERIGPVAEVIAPPTKDFVIVRLERKATSKESAELEAAGFRYDSKVSQWFGNTDAKTNRRGGRPRADLIADAKAIMGEKGPKETEGEFYGSEPETPPAETKPTAAKTKAAPEETKAPTIEEVKKKPDLDDPREQTVISDEQQTAFDKAVEKMPEPEAPKKPTSVTEFVEKPKTTLEQLPGNVRSFLKRQVKLSDEDINGMSVEEATQRGQDFGKEMAARKEQATEEAKRVAANVPRAEPLDDVLSGAPLDRTVKEYSKLIDEAKRLGLNVPNLDKAPRFAQQLVRNIARAIEIRKVMETRPKMRKTGWSEGDEPVTDWSRVEPPKEFAPKATERIVRETEELARRLKQDPGFLQFLEEKQKRGAYEDPVTGPEVRPSEREQYRQERERAALLEKGDPESLDQYAEMLSQLQDREHAVIVRNPLNEKRMEEPRRGPSGDLLGSGFAPLEGLLEMYKAKDPRFWDLLRVVGVGSSSIVGAMEDDEHPLRGALAGALAGMTVAASTSAGRAQMSRYARATKVLAAATKGTGREPYKGTELRKDPQANRDFYWWEAIAPMSVENALPQAYKRITGILTDLNDQMAFGTLGTQVPEIQKSVAKNYMKRAVQEAEAIAKEFEAKGFTKKAVYMKELAAALGKKPTNAGQGVQKFIKGVTGQEVSYDFVERHVGTNAYRLLTGYAAGSALQNLTQPILATRHVSLGDLKFGYKYARTEWGRKMSAHTKIHRPTDIAEDVAGISSQTNVEKMTGVKGWLADSQRLMAASDNYNRRVVYLAAMRAAQRKGLMGDYAREWSRAVNEQTFTQAFRTEANQYAMKIMRDTQGDVGPLAMNPHWRGPLMGSARPFLKYPTLLVRNLLDTAFQPDKRGRNRFIVAMSAAIVLGKQLPFGGLDLEDTLLMGGKPLGLDLTEPGKALGKVAKGDLFPAVKGVKDVYGHVNEFFGGDPSDHEIVPNSAGEALDSDLAYWLLGRYPIQFAKTLGRTIDSDIKPLLKGEERTAHKVRTRTGALNPTSLAEDWLNLSGFKPSRLSERADVLSKAREETYGAAAERKSRVADIKRELRNATDSGNQDARRQLIAELAVVSKSENSVKAALKGLNKTQYERLVQQASPEVRAMLARDYAPLIRDTELR
jgi:hypothetical protein